MASIDFYYLPASAPCRSVMLGAKALGVNLNLKLTSIMEGENRTPEFLKMNIQHTVPTMDDNGFFLNESRAMLQYLANKYGEDSNLYPKDPVERAKIDMKLYFDMGTLYSRFAEAYYPQIFQKLALDSEKVEKLNEALGWLEEYLKDGYVVGNQMTIADFPILSTLSTLDAVGHDLSKFPKVKAYLEKMKGEIKDYDELDGEGAKAFGDIAKAAIPK